jgi:hypothetical protein
MQMNLKMEFVNDPGHGWLIVSRKQLDLVGLQPSDFSSYSYKNSEVNPTHFALEEDCDAGLFLSRCYDLDLRDDMHITETFLNSDAPVRIWPSIN